MHHQDFLLFVLCSALIKSSQLNKIEHSHEIIYISQILNLPPTLAVIVLALGFNTDIDLVTEWFPQVLFCLLPNCLGQQSTAVKETLPVSLINLWPEYQLKLASLQGIGSGKDNANESVSPIHGAFPLTLPFLLSVLF